MPKITIIVNNTGGGVEVGVAGIEPEDVCIIGFDHYEYEESEGEAGVDIIPASDLKDWSHDVDSPLGLANGAGLIPDSVKVQLGL